jgi:hypothetical protein
MLKLKSGKKGGRGQRSWTNESDPISIQHADSALKKDIDFEGMRRDKGLEAGARYDKLAMLFGGEIPRLTYTWDQVLNGEKFKTLNIDEKRAIYHGQPAMRRLRDLTRNQELMNRLNQEDRSLLTWVDLQDYQGTRAEYVKKAEDSAGMTYAVLKDGEWYGRGEMGWFGVSRSELPEGQYEAKFRELIDSLPDDTLLTVVDCHI